MADDLQDGHGCAEMNRDFEDLGRNDPYALLGLPPDASDAEIEGAFRLLARRTHPDLGGDEEAQKRLNVARVVLLDPVRRAEMDERLRRERGEEDAATAVPNAGPEPETGLSDDQFDWTYGTSRPETPPESDFAPYEDQFDWTYGANPDSSHAPDPPWARDSPNPPPPPNPWAYQEQTVYQQPTYQRPQPIRRHWNGLAIASLVLSIIAWWPVALPMAIAALGQTRRRGQRGTGLAWAAITISCLWIVTFLGSL